MIEKQILRLAEIKRGESDDEFLQDGLFCEFAYVYNSENDTLEIYRGFFKKKQAFETKEKIMDALENDGRERYFCHLIIIIDRKKHTKEQVLKAFEEFDTSTEKEDEFEEINPYPEHKIIPLEIPENYVQIVTRGYEGQY